jgi:hypothetical protein
LWRIGEARAQAFLGAGRMEKQHLPGQSEKSRHIGGKPDSRDEADNRKRLAKGKTGAGPAKRKTVKPKNPDVGNIRKDR